MTDPIVITKCGHTFQKDALKKWMEKKRECPLCRVAVNDMDLMPNYTLKALVDDLIQKK